MARTDGGSALARVFLWLAVIGALNWGLVGFFDWDLVRAVAGGDPSTDASGAARVLYALVGLSGLGLLFFAPRMREVRTVDPSRHEAEARA